jgi:hypothetical protein
VSLKTQHGILPIHPTSIVNDPNQGRAAALGMHLNVPRSGIQAVFDQFTHQRGRPLHDLPCRHLAGERVWKNAYFGHEFR